MSTTGLILPALLPGREQPPLGPDPACPGDGTNPGRVHWPVAPQDALASGLFAMASHLAIRLGSSRAKNSKQARVFGASNLRLG